MLGLDFDDYDSDPDHEFDGCGFDPGGGGGDGGGDDDDDGASSAMPDASPDALPGGRQPPRKSGTIVCELIAD